MSIASVFVGRHGRLLLSLVLVTVFAACGAANTVEMKIGECGNPDIIFDSHTWETHESIPDEWRSLSAVNGSFKVGADGATGVFQGPDGVTMTYELVTEEFRSHPCRL
jgi:hypothetical protein